MKELRKLKKNERKKNINIDDERVKETEKKNI